MSALADTFLRCLDASAVGTHPYRHWGLSDVLPADVAEAVVALPFEPAKIGDTYGKRDTNNSSRCFFGPESKERFDVCAAMAEAFQDPRVIGRLNGLCDTDLTGTSLRIEYCQDQDGFWLEPHTDIGVKKFTMLIYLSQGEGAETWGTDIFDGDHELVETAPCVFNSGLIFVPATDTWHGFRKRPINGVRRTLIINYVGPEWRARHELCFPDHAVPRVAPIVSASAE